MSSYDKRCHPVIKAVKLCEDLCEDYVKIMRHCEDYVKIMRHCEDYVKIMQR